MRRAARVSTAAVSTGSLDPAASVASWIRHLSAAAVHSAAVLHDRLVGAAYLRCLKAHEGGGTSAKRRQAALRPVRHSCWIRHSTRALQRCPWRMRAQWPRVAAATASSGSLLVEVPVPVAGSSSSSTRSTPSATRCAFAGRACIVICLAYEAPSSFGYPHPGIFVSSMPNDLLLCQI